MLAILSSGLLHVTCCYVVTASGQLIRITGATGKLPIRAAEAAHYR